MSFVIKGGKHDDRRVEEGSFTTKFLYNLVTCCIRKHDIAYDDIRLGFCYAFYGFFSIHICIDVEILAHSGRYLLEHIHVVLNDSKGDIVE